MRSFDLKTGYSNGLADGGPVNGFRGTYDVTVVVTNYFFPRYSRRMPSATHNFKKILQIYLGEV